VRFDKPKMREVSKMRKFMLMGALVAIVIAALSIPAMAQDGIDDERQAFQDAFQAAFADSWEEAYEDRAEENRSFEDFYSDFADYYGFGEDEYWGDDGYQWDEGDGGSYYGVGQSFEQEAESGDVSQSFNVSNTGSNSNQCAGIQGVANTGNAQNQIGVIQYGSEADDFSFEDSGASITVSPNSFTSCDQQVNQSASAFGW
jgi:hypothetical protein